MSQQAEGFVGASVERSEDDDLLTGRGEYVGDLQRRGMLEMAVKRSTQAHAWIRSIDVSKAEALDGVEEVLTYDDIRDDVNRMPCLYHELGAYDNLKPALHTVLADQKVRYVGEPVAAVVAADRYVAEDALDRIRVSYEGLDPVMSVEEALDENSPRLFEQFDTNMVNTIEFEAGDVDGAFERADRIVEEEFFNHRLTASFLEPRGVMADARTPSGRIDVWSSTQTPHTSRSYLADVLEVPESRIHYAAPDVGGGFGPKGMFYPEEVLVPLASLRLDRPVRWLEDRQENFEATTHGREQTATLKAAVSDDGEILGIEADIYTDTGGALSTKATTDDSVCASMLRNAYRIPHYRANTYCVLTNKTPTASYRGVGHAQAVFYMERMIDRIARETKLDRLELRRKNVLQPEEFPVDRETHSLVGPVEYDSGNYPRCMENALEQLDYDGFLREKTTDGNEDPRLYGLGIANAVEMTSPGPFESARVGVDSSGTIAVSSGVTSQGQGTATALAQIVADELQVDPDQIDVRLGDTGETDDGLGAWASRCITVGGTAVAKAAEQVREQALDLGAHVLEADRRDLEFHDGAVAVKGAPEQQVDLGELAEQAKPMNPSFPDDLDHHLQASYIHKPEKMTFSNSTHAVIVAINPRTGELEIPRYSISHDCGTVVNPMLLEGQVQGGLAQGLGAVLMEEIQYDESGQLKTGSFQHYPLPAVDNMPPVEIDHQVTPSPHNPHGMKGAGEGGTIPVTAAVTAAINDALPSDDLFLTDDGPYTPARVYELIQQTQANQPTNGHE